MHPPIVWLSKQQQAMIVRFVLANLHLVCTQQNNVIRLFQTYNILHILKKMNPPAFPLKTGFSNLQPGLTADQKQTLEKLLLVFVKQAFGHAATYAKAAQRSVVLSTDLKLGLKVAALPTKDYSFWDQNIHAELAEIDAMAEEEASDEEADEDDDFVVETDEVWTAAPSSHSDLVRRMNEVEAKWETWEPNDIMGRAIKNAVYQM